MSMLLCYIMIYKTVLTHCSYLLLFANLAQFGPKKPRTIAHLKVSPQQLNNFCVILLTNKETNNKACQQKQLLAKLPPISGR